MTNEVTITVTANDRTKAGFSSIRRTVDSEMQQITRLVTTKGKESADGFGKSFDTAASGLKLGAGFLQSFSDTAVQMISRAGVMGVAGFGAALATLPAVAGPIGGAIGAAFGAGLAGIGVAAAAQSNLVQRAFADLKVNVQSELLSIAGPLEQSLLKIPDVVRDMGAKLKPFLADAFASMAPAIDNFVASVGRGVASLGPAFQPLADGFNAILNELSARSPQIFENLRDGLTKFGELAQDWAPKIADLVEGITKAFELTADSLQFLSTQFGPAKEEVNQFTRQMVESMGGVDKYRETMQRLGVSSHEIESALQEAGLATKEVGESANSAAKGIGDLRSEFDQLTGAALNADEAASAFQEAIDEVSKSVQENGKTIDINTEKGRANRDALREMAKAAQDHLVAMVEEGQGVGAVSVKYQQYRSQLVESMQQAGLTRAAAEKLTDSWLGVPKSVKTTITAQTSAAEAAIKKVRDLMDSVKSKTVYMTVQEVLKQVPGVSLRQLMNAHGGIIGGIGARFQNGGIAGAGSSMALVGEQGPELVRLPVGSTVIPNGQSMRMMSGGQQESITVNLYIQGSIRSDRDLVALIRNEFANGGFRGALTT